MKENKDLYEDFQKAQGEMLQSWNQLFVSMMNPMDGGIHEHVNQFITDWWKVFSGGLDVFGKGSLYENRLYDLWEKIFSEPMNSDFLKDLQGEWQSAFMAFGEKNFLDALSGVSLNFSKSVFRELRNSTAIFDSWEAFVNENETLKEYVLEWEKAYRTQAKISPLPSIENNKRNALHQREAVEASLYYLENLLEYYYLLGHFAKERAENYWLNYDLSKAKNYEFFLDSWTDSLKKNLNEFYNTEEYQALEEELVETLDKFTLAMNKVTEDYASMMPFVNKSEFEDQMARIDHLEMKTENYVKRSDLENFESELESINRTLNKYSTDVITGEKKLQNFVPREELESFFAEKNELEDLASVSNVLKEDVQVNQRALEHSVEKTKEFEKRLEDLEANLKEKDNKIEALEAEIKTLKGKKTE